MKEVAYGEDVELIELDEVFKYVTKTGTEYTLMCLHDGLRPCVGCVFSINSNHPLKSIACTGNGLECENRIFKAIDQVLENL
jgi:hypothetical protein